MRCSDDVVQEGEDGRVRMRFITVYATSTFPDLSMPRIQPVHDISTAVAKDSRLYTGPCGLTSPLTGPMYYCAV